ncbi:MAG: HPr family phosphocarrier protein [Gammaproteobacteria bacterium]|nr:HPr family phosphocarrier protein [Gammaproteobacteria bacterium]
MITRTITIINKLGLHARAAAKLVTLASQFECEVQLKRNQRVVNGKSIMAVMLLAASKGTELEVITDGADETDATDAILQLINNKFDEAE